MTPSSPGYTTMSPFFGIQSTAYPNYAQMSYSMQPVQANGNI